MKISNKKLVQHKVYYANPSSQSVALDTKASALTKGRPRGGIELPKGGFFER